jgi:hypothetical protein
MFKRSAVIILPVLVALAFSCGCGESGRDAGVEPDEEYSIEAEVPEEYEAIYDELDVKLAELEAYLDENGEGRSGDTVFSVELVIANANRGEALLYQQTFAAIQRTLQSLQDLGVGGITLSVQYPVLNPDFPRSSEYVDFYRDVATEVKSHGFILIVETTSVFPNPEISSLGVDYSGLTLDEYMGEKRAMVETVLRELAPDYLTIENEPITQQINTGLDFSVANLTRIVNHILSGLDRAGAKIGAGAGSWDDLAYFESLAANTGLDYLDMHFYPIQGDLVAGRAELVSEMARSAGKSLAVNETWLYKAAGSELSAGQNIAMAADIFARDAYSFWAPLDRAFLEVMVKLSRYLELEFMSPFWMQYLYAYLEYDTSTQGMGYAEVQSAMGREAWRNIDYGVLSPTGETYRDLIR